MTKYQCPLCRADFIEPAKNELPDELVKKIIQANRPSTTRWREQDPKSNLSSEEKDEMLSAISQALGMDDLSYEDQPNLPQKHYKLKVTPPDPVSSWDGEIPLCVECVEYFEDLWENEHTNDLQKGLELYGTYLYYSNVSREGSHCLSVDGLAKKLLDDEKSNAAAAQKVLGYEQIEEILEEFRKRYTDLKVDPYAWNSGHDFFPLVNPGVMTFSRRRLYELGITASVMRRLKVVAIDYMSDNLNTLRGFQLEYHKGQLEILSRWQHEFRSALGPAERFRLAQIRFDRELRKMIRAHETSLKSWSNLLRESGWLRTDKKGGRHAFIGYQRAVFRTKEIFDNEIFCKVQGRTWRSGVKGFTRSQLIGIILIMLGICDERYPWMVKKGLVRLDTGHRSYSFNEENLKKSIQNSYQTYKRFLSSQSSPT